MSEATMSDQTLTREREHYFHEWEDSEGPCVHCFATRLDSGHHARDNEDCTALVKAELISVKNQAAKAGAELAEARAGEEAAFNAGYSWGYGNGHTDADQGEDYNSDPKGAYRLWVDEDERGHREPAVFPAEGFALAEARATIVAYQRADEHRTAVAVVATLGDAAAEGAALRADEEVRISALELWATAHCQNNNEVGAAAAAKLEALEARVAALEAKAAEVTP